MKDTWTLTPVAFASLPVPGWECVFGRNDCTMQDLIFWVWLLRCGDKICLIDAGLPTGADLERLNEANQKLDPQSIFTIKQDLRNALARDNIRPEDIDFVLISQLITYCTGGLIRENFPSAHVYCAWDGMREFLTSTPGHPPRDFYLTAESWTFFRELLIENRLTFAESKVEVAPGLFFEPTGGHHPGSAGIRAQTERGVVGILETAFIQENIDRTIPIGIAEDAARCRQVIQTYKRECDLVLAGHDPRADQTLKKFLA